MEGYDVAVQSGLFHTNYWVYKNPVKKFAPVVSNGKDVFDLEKETGDVKAAALKKISNNLGKQIPL